MSLYRQVKTLFTLSSLIFTYIIWATASTVLLNNTVDYKVYIISLASVFLMQYIMKKKKKPLFQVGIPFLSAIAANVIIFNRASAGYNAIYIFFTLLFFNKLENEEINYEVYKSRVKKFLYILIALGVFLSLGNKGLAEEILRFYLIYLISAIIVLRETRKFTSKINGKKSIYANLTIIFSVILLSMDKIYNFLTMIFSYAWRGTSFVLSEIAIGISYILVYVIFRPLSFIVALIINNLGKRGHVNNQEINSQATSRKVIDLLEQKDSNNALVFMIILKIIIVIIIVYLMFKAFDSYVKKSSYDDGSEIQKEKILIEKKNKRSKEGNLFKLMKVFKGEKNVRIQILNIYLKFEQKMSDKEIYKPHMTASELSSRAKTQISDIEAIDSITSIYNEAKFSDHKIPEKNVQKAKLNYESLRKKG